MTGRRLAGALVVASIGWPVALGAALVDHLDHAPRLASTLVYLAASRVCHQRADRSFATDDVPWPVCGRCTGLYALAPLGALIAFGRRRRLDSRAAALGVGVTAVPTAATIAIEWLSPALMSSSIRMVAAWPLGAFLGFVLVSVAGRMAPTNRVH